ncbi:MAG: hypothetical protein RI935_421 [Candidatus Parcubacteria bacterium]|jgi:hypothetical protein
MKHILLALSLLLTTFLISRYVFEPANLYHELPLLDIPMHFLGGFLIGYLVMSVFNYYNKPLSKKLLIISISIVAVVWELYEYNRGVLVFSSWLEYWDTILDYILGVAGAYYAFIRNHK